MPERKMTLEEAEALAILVRGGWLKLELTNPPERSATPPHADRNLPAARVGERKGNNTS